MAQTLDGGQAHRVGVVSPESFDVYDQWFHNVEFVWTARSIQPVDLDRIDRWDSIGSVAKTGRLRADQTVSPGGAPNRLLYVQADGRLGPGPTGHISMLPLSHGADSFGYQAKDLPKGFSADEESWAWLLNPGFRGVALQNNASIGLIDAILAAQAANLVGFADPGNLTIEEIDQLMDVLMGLRRQGHFSAFWTTPDDLSRLIDRRRTKLYSLWSPVLGIEAGVQKRVHSAVPKEGYRGWFGGMAISRHCRGNTLDMVYEYLNWWLDGWPGAVVARHGYYFSAPERARSHLTANEWEYWYCGGAATEEVLSNAGRVIAAKGEFRDGGSYSERVSQIAIWNAVMDEHNYLSRRWNDLLNYKR